MCEWLREHLLDEVHRPEAKHAATGRDQIDTPKVEAKADEEKEKRPVRTTTIYMNEPIRRESPPPRGCRFSSGRPNADEVCCARILAPPEQTMFSENSSGVVFRREDCRARPRRHDSNMRIGKINRNVTSALVILWARLWADARRRSSRMTTMCRWERGKKNWFRSLQAPEYERVRWIYTFYKLSLLYLWR